MINSGESQRGWHPSRVAAVNALQRATDASAHEVYRTSFFQHYQKDARYGFQTVFYRGIAIPSAAAERINGTDVLNDPQRWIVDNTFEMCELIWNGLDSDRGQTLVKAMRYRHDSIPISPENRTYMMCSFIVTPYEHVDQWSWRRSLPIERDAAHAFIKDLSGRAGISGIPDTYDETVQYLRDFEQTHQQPSDDARRIVEAVDQAIASYSPPGGGALTLSTLAVMVNNRSLTDALGLQYPSPAVERAIKATVKGRALALARRPMPKGVEWFWPGRPVRMVYPLGYDVTDKGFMPRQT